MCVLNYSSFVCRSAYAYVCKSKVLCGSAIRFGRALPGIPYYCAPLVCVPDVIGVLAVWWHNKKKKKQFQEKPFPSWGGNKPNQETPPGGVISYDQINRINK